MKMIIRGIGLEKLGYDKGFELTEVTEQGRCENCNKDGIVFVIEGDIHGIGLCHNCLINNYEDCEFEEVVI